MLRKILIANRGEIALRILRACKEMGIATVAVYSQADEAALHKQLADESVCIGPAPSRDSYLNMKNILAAAVGTGCDAIHPGFGFLSESAAFARLAATCGIKFIGPTAEIIEQMGDKATARRMVQKANVPVVPGSEGLLETAQDAAALAETIGYPVLIKASAGGGGRGMRRAFSQQELLEQFDVARAEAQACFGDGSMYLEKLILSPKHIEIQIMADECGNTVHLGERDCSIQRRNQKMIEESPCHTLTPALREEMGQAAVRAAQAVGYQNAGTVEFVLDKQGNFYFIEMNTRIQVEHPVTEMVTGIDLIKEQIRVASGLPLSFNQQQVVSRGHAIECRINAEDCKHDFRPCPGQVRTMHLPGGPGVRVDTALYPGCIVSPHYDSMLAKLIVHGNTRLEAIRRMRRCLEEFLVEGPETNVELQYVIMHHEEFVKGTFTTDFMERHLGELL